MPRNPADPHACGALTDRRQFLARTALLVPGAALSKTGRAEERSPLAVRGLLIHASHYDPNWVPEKEREAPFSLDVALEVVETMAGSGLNTLIVDLADGVEYRSHPELRRHYSVPMAQLEELSSRCRALDVEFVPKLNFAKSGRNLHDMWMKPHWDLRNFVSREEEYWGVARDLIDEIVERCRPARFFHIGMDEDHHRSVAQFVRAVSRLRTDLSSHGLRAVMWNDTCYENRNVIAEVHADKCRAAEPSLPRDVVQLLWDYDIVHAGIVARLTGAGFETWVAPGLSPEMVRDWARVLRAEGGDRGRGLVLTRWRKCDEAHRAEILGLIRELGPIVASA